MNTNTLNISDIFNLHTQYENDIAAGQPLPIPPSISPSEQIKKAQIDAAEAKQRADEAKQRADEAEAKFQEHKKEVEQ